MKRIIVSLSIIAAVAAIVIGATTAYFSDTETSKGNTFTAGTIDLAVNGENPFNSAVVTIDDIKPCEEKIVEVTLSNVGTNDGIADLHILEGTPSEGIDSEPECEAERKEWNPTSKKCVGDETLNENICDIMTYDYCYDLNNNGKCDEEDEKGTIKPCERIYLGLLPKNESRKLWLSFHLPADAENEYQGDTCTFDIEFSLEQLKSGQSGKGDLKDGNETKGWFAYWPGSSVTFEVHASGLPADGCYQITLEDAGRCTEVGSLLAQGVQGHTGTFDAGYWNGYNGLMTVCCPDGGDDCPGLGVYNPEYVMVQNGKLDTVFTIETKDGDTPWPALPAGDYSNLRMVIKQINAGQETCPVPGEAPVWNCDAGVECYIGKLSSDYEINFSLPGELK